MKRASHLPIWTIAAPAAAWLLLGVHVLFDAPVLTVLIVAGLLACVVAAVHHAELIAHRIGEPYGAFVLAGAVTIIEVALIVTLMAAERLEASALARDAVFATVMIILNGIVGLCLVVGGSRHHEQHFELLGVSAALATLAAIVVLALVLPNYTTTVAGPIYSPSQLGFVAVVSLLLYTTFLFVQAIRHRDHFLAPGQARGDEGEAAHAGPKASGAVLAAGVGLLLASLIAVVLLAKTVSPAIEAGVARAGAPRSVVGVIIAAIVLLPEGWAALRAAQANRLQTSLNLALGSALASIGLTIPAVAMVSLHTGLTLTLGIDMKAQVLLLLTLFVSTLSLGTGRTTVLQGAVHLVIFAVYLFTTVVP